MSVPHQNFVKDVIAGLIASKVVVYGPRIAVVRDPEEEKVGRIIIPESGRKKEPRGTVVAVGLGVDLEDDVIAGMQVGDQIMYTKYNPTAFYVTLPGQKDKVCLELLHVSDIYIGWRQ